MLTRWTEKLSDGPQAGTSDAPLHWQGSWECVDNNNMRSGDMLRLGMVGSNEESAEGYDNTWLTYRCLNRLCTGYTYGKEQRKKLGYFNGDTICVCGIA